MDKVNLNIQDCLIDTFTGGGTWIKITHSPTGISVAGECIEGQIKTRHKLLEELEKKINA